jgi:hypothetical protein
MEVATVNLTQTSTAYTVDTSTHWHSTSASNTVPRSVGRGRGRSATTVKSAVTVPPTSTAQDQGALNPRNTHVSHVLLGVIHTQSLPTDVLMVVDVEVISHHFAYSIQKRRIPSPRSSSLLIPTTFLGYPRRSSRG